MKKASILIIALFFGMALNIFSQAPVPAEFYVGKWEITIFGTPNGDSKMTATITRKDGKLVGELTNPEDQNAKMPIDKIEEADGKMDIYFSAGGYDLNIPFEKVDDDNLKGQLMNMFDTKAKRVK